MEQQKQAEREGESQTLTIQEKITKTNGEVMIKKYSRGNLLGRGGFAKCYEITNLESKRISAAKIIAKSSLNRSRAKQKLITEIKIHKTMNHQHIVKFEHVFQDHDNVYILLEICSNHTLNELIKRRKRLTQVEVQYYLWQIVSALMYLHQNKVIHRDLKLGNMFLNDSLEIKLGDFGLATRLEYNEEKKKTICGTPNYIAPEILEAKGHSYEVDVWSAGVIIYTLLIGKPPFETPDVKSTYKKIKACSYEFPQSVTISDNARNLIKKILVLDPSKRPTLEEILSDPFMCEPIPREIPKSTLNCPPPRAFIEQYTKKEQRSREQGLSSRPSTSNLERMPKKESEKYQAPKEQVATKIEAYSASTSSKDLKPTIKAGTQIQPPVKKEKTSEIHVKKWVDYSTKYGLGYLLTDGSTGVYFNDSTKIIADKNGQNFQYIEKKHDKDTILSYTMSDFPPERQLQKKVTLLQHFRNYLNSDAHFQPQHESTPDAGHIYVKKWMKTKYAIMFRLSNKIVQVNFTDKTEIILSSQQKLVTYTDLKGDKSEYPLATALDNRNAEMAKRLKYTKEILTHMLNGTSLPVNAGAEELN